MATAETKTAALLLSFSALVFLLLAREVLLQPPAPRRRRGALADLLLAALDRLLDGRGLLDLATRRNMVLLCHAILLVILMDAGVLRRRGAAATVTAAAGAEEGACSAPPQPRARSVVVWRRQRNRAAAAGCDDAPRRLAERQRRPRGPRAAEAAAPWAAPALAGPAVAAEPLEEELVSTKQIVLVHTAPRCYDLLDDDDHDRAAIVELEHQAPASATDGTTGSDRGTADAAAEEASEMELADDRRIEEFIAKQRSKMWQEESLQLAVRAAPQQQAIAAW